MKALLLLLRLNGAASIRRLVRGIGTPKGALLSLLTLGIACFVFVPSVAMYFTRDAPSSQNLVQYAPFAMFAYLILALLTSAGEKAIVFTPSEIDFLFTAPFTRRELLGYKIVGTLVTSCVLGVLMTAAFAYHFHNLFYAVCALSMTFLFLALAGMLITLVGQYAAENAFSRGRQLLALVMLVFFAAAMSQAMKQVEFVALSNFPAWAKEISTSNMGRIVLAPFNPFCYAMAADEFSKFAIWISVAALINAGMIGGILLMDANYLEAAARISHRFYEHQQRIKKSGGAAAKLTSRSVRWRIPMLPRMSGFGPMAWRQLTSVIRQSKGILVVLVILAACLVAPNLVNITNELSGSPVIVLIVFAAFAYISLLFSIQSPFGFRADVDHIDVFKALPIQPFQVAAGQLVGSVTLFASLHWAVSILGMVVTQKWVLWWLTGMVVAVPFNVLLFSVANGLFLLFPVRNAFGTKDIQAVGQSMLFAIFQIFVVIGATLVSALPAAAAYGLTGSLILSALLALVALSATSVAGVFFTAWAYNRFDVSAKPV
jgi:hypothetical protein